MAHLPASPKTCNHVIIPEQSDAVPAAMSLLYLKLLYLPSKGPFGSTGSGVCKQLLYLGRTFALKDD